MGKGRASARFALPDRYSSALPLAAGNIVLVSRGDHPVIFHFVASLLRTA
jgi:hypothetical protein